MSSNEKIPVGILILIVPVISLGKELAFKDQVNSPAADSDILPVDIEISVIGVHFLVMIGKEPIMSTYPFT